MDGGAASCPIGGTGTVLAASPAAQNHFGFMKENLRVGEAGNPGPRGDSFRAWLDRSLAREDEANRINSCMEADSIHRWLRNHGELEANRYDNELLNMIWRHGDPGENQPSSDMERWHYPGPREDLLRAYLEFTLAREEEASWLHSNMVADSIRRRQRDHEEHEENRYEEELINKIWRQSSEEEVWRPARPKATTRRKDSFRARSGSANLGSGAGSREIEGDDPAVTDGEAAAEAQPATSGAGGAGKGGPNSHDGHSRQEHRPGRGSRGDSSDRAVKIPRQTRQAMAGAGGDGSQVETQELPGETGTPI